MLEDENPREEFYIITLKGHTERHTHGMALGFSKKNLQGQYCGCSHGGDLEESPSLGISGSPLEVLSLVIKKKYKNGLQKDLKDNFTEF